MLILKEHSNKPVEGFGKLARLEHGSILLEPHFTIFLACRQALIELVIEYWRLWH